MFEKGNRANTLHGILLIALFSFAAFYIAEIPFVKSLSFSPLIVGIILGMLYANSLRNKLPETWVPGIKFCTKQILRAGIVLYGFRLTLTQVAAVGLPAVIVDTVIVAGTIFLGVWLGKMMKMDKDTSLMTATGSAICGAAAVLASYRSPVPVPASHTRAIAWGNRPSRSMRVRAARWRTSVTIRITCRATSMPNIRPGLVTIIRSNCWRGGISKRRATGR